MELFSYDLHVHTSQVSPCARVKAEQAVQFYHQKGYAGLLITDHFYTAYLDSLGERPWRDKMDAYLSGYRAARAASTAHGMDILLGMEIRFQECANDYLVLGLQEDMLYETPDFLTPTLAQFLPIKERYGLRLYQAHPFRAGLCPRSAPLIDGVEVYNGNPRHNSRNDLAAAYATRQDLPGISGSDFHQPGDEARGGILLTRRVRSSRELLRVLTEGNYRLR